MNTLEFKPQTLRDRLEMEMNSVHSNRILKSLETIKKIFLLANLSSHSFGSLTFHNYTIV